jgi:hypothetical protein
MDLTSFDGVLVALFVILPGVIAARTYRQSADLRDAGNTEGRVASTLAWAAAIGGINAFFISPLRSGFESLTEGRWAWSIVLLPVLLLVVPYTIGLGAGLLSRLEPVREFLKRFGLLSTRERTPWDNLSSESLWIYFGEGDVRYRGALERADVDIKQLLLTNVEVLHGDSWDKADQSDALLLDGERKVMWLYRPNKKGK